ncbi:MAG TPA: sigma factor-like helix-turn-helix DNA-binding protein [Myxococcales bacterium]|jgi:RNA polymerase sigma-70 factor (ECF subfamily)
MRIEEEAVLVLGLRRRDSETFARFWSAQQRRLWSIASAALGDGASAEAALRETLELAWAECDRVKGDPAAWLVSILGQVLLARGSGSAATTDAGCGEGARGRVLEALSGLSSADRTLLLLHHLGGLDAEALARLARTDSKSVRRAIHRGRFAIVELMNQTDGRLETASPCVGQRRSTRGGNHVSNRRGRGSHRGARVTSRAGEGPLRHR